MGRKYSYDRKGLRGLTPFPFLGEVKTRLKAIDAAPDTMPQSVFSANILASVLHPAVQYVKVEKVVDHGGAKSFTLVPDTEKGTKNLAYFRAGQYVSVALEINGAVLNKPYTIASSPKEALEGSYTLTVKATRDGFASAYILSEWKEGTKVKISGPLGEFYHQELRDAETVIAVAGGSGITPFISMAGAVADGTENFNLTVLYGSRTADSILLGDKLGRIAASSKGRVKVVNVLSDEEKEGFEHGFISSDIIRKYAPEGEYSLFMCGPGALYDYEKGEVEKLGLRKRFVRMELSGDRRISEKDTSFPKDKLDKEYRLTVVIRGEKKEITALSTEPILWAVEKAGIKAPSHCRSGECGWCHSRLVKGDVFVRADNDGRRAADRKFGWIHPCSTYALSDVEIEIYPPED